MMQKQLLIVTLLSFTTSCGELSFKRGAGGADLARDKSLCKTNQSNIELNTCLEAKGWALKNLNEISLFENLKLTAKPSEALSKDAVPIDRLQPIHSVTESKRSLMLASPKQQNTVDTEHGYVETMIADSIDLKLDASTSSKAAKAEVLSETNLQQPILANPLDQFIINAWWKLGARDHAFAKDAEACHERLGDSHAPNHLLQQYSAAFLICMREKEWKAAAKALLP